MGFLEYGHFLALFSIKFGNSFGEGLLVSSRYLAYLDRRYNSNVPAALPPPSLRLKLNFILHNSLHLRNGQPPTIHSNLVFCIFNCLGLCFNLGGLTVL